MCIDQMISFLEEDKFREDITTQCTILEDREVFAKIISKSRGVLAGVEYVKKLYEHFNFKVDILKQDGSNIGLGDIVLELSGPIKLLLSVERTSLNILMRMSGIATETKKLVDLLPKNIKVAATRKTVPGFRFFDKKAVEIGGGGTHRFNLSDAILIKDNHLKFIDDIKSRVSKSKKEHPSIVVEIEAEELQEALEYAESGADIILLDNFKINDIRDVLSSLEAKNIRNKIKIEVSGNITPENVEKYTDLDVDVISFGYLTHSSKSLDFSLNVA